MSTSSTVAMGTPQVVSDVFDFGTDLLVFFPEWLSQLIVAVVLVVLAILAVVWIVRTVLPWAGPACARLLTGLVYVVGYAALVVEYIPTRVLRSFERRPPGLVYVFDALVIRSTTVIEYALKAGLGVTRYFSKLPKWMVVVLMLLVLGGWHQTQCDSDDASCRRPIDVWRMSTVDWFRATFASNDPCPMPTTPVAKKMSTRAPTCEPTEPPQPATKVK